MSTDSTADSSEEIGSSSPDCNLIVKRVRAVGSRGSWELEVGSRFETDDNARQNAEIDDSRFGDVHRGL